MPRRNKVPETVSTETPRAKALEKRRRDAIADAERRARTPAIGPRTEIDKLAQAEASETARRSTGPLGTGLGAYPKALWDQMTVEEQDEVIRRSQLAQEYGAMMAARAALDLSSVGAIRNTPWYGDLVDRYGSRSASRAADLLASEPARRFFWKDNPAKVVEDARTYERVNDVIRKLGGDPDTGRAVIGGSVSINKAGTLNRATAISHDLDISGYTANASKIPWEPYPYVTPESGHATVSNGWYDRYVAPLENWRAAAEDAPLLRRIREQYPATHGNAGIEPWDWKTMRLGSQADRYRPGVFRQIGDGYSMSSTAGNNIFLGTEIDGVPVDIFLSDARLSRVPGTPYAEPEVAFSWKNAYTLENAERGLPARPKDMQDFADFRRFSRQNPIVDPVTHHAQFSPPNFGDRILSPEGLPVVRDVPTWPGSGETVPMMMNTEGKMIAPFDRNALHQDAKGGNSVRAAEAGGDAEPMPGPSAGLPADLAGGGSGPRIVINPSTFHNRKDALCVAFNEGFRLWMEATGFEPRSEPTDAQRKFFSDTAYADDELQLRRTILARIATFDTSVKDPTDDQLAETAEFLGAILESDWCKNDWERDSVSRLAQAAQAAVGAEPVEPREVPLEVKEQEPLQARAAMGGGETEDEERITPPPATGEDLNGDGTAIDHQADVIAQAEAENESDREEADAEYAKLQASGALADNASFDNEAPEMAQKPAQEPSAAQSGEDTRRAAAAQPAPGESPNPAQSASEEPLSPAKPRRRGAIEDSIVSPDSPGSISFKGTRRGGIENPIVNPDSPGSISFKGVRRGGIENPIVSPESEGSIAFSGTRTGGGGGGESPIVDPDSPGSLSYRRRKKRWR